DDVHAEGEHAAAGVVGPLGELGVDGDGAPVLLVLFAGGGDALDGGPEFFVFPLGEDAEDLREVAGADKEQIDAVDGGDFLALFQGAGRFDLDSDEVVFVGVGGELRQRFAAVEAVVAAGVHAAVAARGELD